MSGGFHPAKRGPLPDPRPQVFGEGENLQEGESSQARKGGAGKPRETDVFGGFLPKRVGSITLSQATGVSGN